MLENKACLIGIPAVSIAYGAAQLVEANALDIARVPQGGNLEQRHAAEHYERGSPLLTRPVEDAGATRLSEAREAGFRWLGSVLGVANMIPDDARKDCRHSTP